MNPKKISRTINANITQNRAFSKGNRNF
jgi:hypothetical protein